MMYRITNILYSQRLWREKQQNKSIATRAISTEPIYGAVISQIPEETYHYEASIEESEVEVEPHDQISQAVLLVPENQTEEHEIISCQHPHSALDQDIEIVTKQQEDQEESAAQLIVDASEQDKPEFNADTTAEQEITQVIDIKQEELSAHAAESKQDDDDLSIEIVPKDEEVVESLTIDTSSFKMMPPIDKEEEVSLSSSCSSTSPKTPPSSSHNSSFLNKSKTTTSLLRRETKKLNERRKSLGKKIKGAFHPKPTKRFTI
ncbi:hypothetical protein K501DRAFT_328671 [Backusella circina FSU 941]|nr:hypothetical protein K501DRAFT_328671 [Backusella circina FSU 941]